MTKTTKNVLVTIPVIFLLLALTIPNFIKIHFGGLSRNACVNNLEGIELAKKKWALENQKTTNSVPTEDDLRPYLTGWKRTNGFPKCPNGGIYEIGRIGESPKCSIGGTGHTLVSE